MKGKKIVFVIVTILCVITIMFFLFNTVQNKADKPYSEIINAASLFQNAIKNRDMKKIWDLSPKLKRQRMDDNYDKFKEAHSRWFQENQREVKVYSEARLGKVRMITPNRAWVECISSDASFTGFYMVKEDGKWKYYKLGAYVELVDQDIDALNETIKRYYADKRNLPYSLSELVPDYIRNLPVDRFSDEERIYNYEVLGDTSWKIYSIGVDGRDDSGVIFYDRNLGTEEGIDAGFGAGDIVWEDKIK